MDILTLGKIRKVDGRVDDISETVNASISQLTTDTNTSIADGATNTATAIATLTNDVNIAIAGIDVNTVTGNLIISGNASMTDINASGDLGVSGYGVFSNSIKVGNDTRTAATAGAGAMRFNAGGLEQSDGAAWAAIYEAPLDGSSCALAPTSGSELKQQNPGLGSGNYYIKPNGQACITMYVDMTRDGGGYDFYYITGGASGNRITDHSMGQFSCPAGTKLAIPRSHDWWVAARAWKPDWMNGGHGSHGVYKTSGGGNYTGCIMRSSHYGSHCNDWRVHDGGKWWLRDNTFSEPNGDYCGNCFLGGYSWVDDGGQTGNVGFNDGSSGANSGSNYLCSSNVHNAN